MSDEVIPLLKVHGYFHGVPDIALQEVVAHAQVTEHAAGAVVHEANVLLSSIGFVLRGRLKAVRVDSHGTESLFRMIDRGEQFGMMAGALSEPVPIRVIALEPTTLLRLDYEQAIDLSFRYPELRRLWLTAFAGNLKKHFFGATTRRAPMMLALIHESPASRRAAERLTARLHELGEKIAVFSDSDDWTGPPEVRLRRLLVDGRMLELDEIRQQAGAWQDADRIIFDVHVDLEMDRTGRLMEVVDRAIYFVPAGAADVAVRRLQERAAPNRGWRDKICIAWLLAEGSPIGPAVPNLGDLVSRDFKIAETPPGPPWGQSVASGMERLVHDLRGVRIGVALGGGAARGMSHLGVLKALEQSGIVVDMIAGTSAGAMTGVIHASGLDPDHSVGLFANDLKPSWIFRHLPAGEHWYLVYKYRRGQFDPMLRKYLHDSRLEQLPIPCKTVTVDLVSSKAVVRERGDSTHAILESINLPVLSVPICRGGQALIDGGLVNNVPADVLVSLGCNFVIAVSVSAKIETQFCEITPDRPTPTVTKPTILRTLLRSFLVQNHCMNSLGVQPADIVIEPDVTGFEATQFSRTRELAAVGEAAARAQIPKIKQLLARLDPQLFGKVGDHSGLQ